MKVKCLKKKVNLMPRFGLNNFFLHVRDLKVNVGMKFTCEEFVTNF